jgi:myosin-5
LADLKDENRFVRLRKYNYSAGMPPKKAVDISKILVPVWAKPGKAIWVEIMDKDEVEPKEYLKGRIDQVFEEKKMISIIYDGNEKGEKDVYAHRVLERAEEPQVLEDLVDIDPLNDAELLRCLQMRFANDDVYCWCGPTLLATNPYKKIDKSSLQEHKEMFREFALKGGKVIKMPHIWNLAAQAFYQLFANEKKQAVCISGESGAGKTVGTKLCMSFITSLFENDEPAAPKDSKGEHHVPIEDKILDCNPVMESFGNAKTVRNDNSSRFGKYFIMYVDKNDKHIKGAEIRNYLLEKSRVVIQAKTERNYHVFYGILRFMDPNRLKQYGYFQMEKYNYLKKSECFQWETIDDKEFFTDTCSSFNRLGFNQEEQDGVFKTLATVLNLGNVQIDSSTFIEGEQPCGIKMEEYFEKVLKILEVDREEFIEGICCQKRTLPGGQVLLSPRTPANAEAIRDALAKDMFNNVFNWIVRKLNLTLLPENPKQYTSVGLLDIFGFEDFNVNSIEQFCINYTNEKLQNLYISYVFKAEKVIFMEEGLGDFLNMIKFTDNLPIIEMLDKPPMGIFHLIDSVGKLATDTPKDDEKLMNEITKNFGSSPYIFFDKLNREKFGIKHTAKDVYYYSPGFIEKNKDELPGNLVSAFSKGNKVIVRIFTKKLRDDEDIAEKVNNPMEKFLGYKFRMNMQELMDELMTCECNFVRCIKPNEAKRKDFWVPELALKQIRYLGILDSIKVRRESLPIRKMYMDFYQRYQDLDDLSSEKNTPFLTLKNLNPDWKKMAMNAVHSVDKQPKPDECLFGNRRVFMSTLFANKIETVLEAKQKVKRVALEKIASAFRTFAVADKWDTHRRRLLKVISLSKNLLETWNSKMEYIKFKRVLKIATRMQKKFRNLVERRNLRLQRFSIAVIGRSYRMFKIKSVLYNAKRIIVNVDKCARKVMYRAFLAKITMNDRVVNDIFEIAWKMIEDKMKTDSCLTVQRMFRGYKYRLLANEEVEKLKVLKEEVRRQNAAIIVQKHVRGFIVRSRMDRLHRAAAYIQGYTRMLWLSRYFQEMRTAARKIQRAVRKYLLKTKKSDEHMADFLVSSKQYIANLRVVEHDIIFRQKEALEDIRNIELYTKVKYFEDEKSFKQSVPSLHSFIPDPPNIDLNPKMRMFSVVIDFDCQVDTSDIYENSWAVDFLNFFQNVKSKGSRLLHLDVGESFTLAMTDDMKMYSWGLNDYCQLARKIVPTYTHNEPQQIKILGEIAPRMIATGDEHTIMIDYSNEVYAWGSNMAGQLGVGHSREPRSVVKLTSLKQNVKYIAAKGRQSYLITNDGKLYQWPNLEAEHKFSPSQCRISDPMVSFSQISVGMNFAIALTTNGLLYSNGSNHSGQLGLGDQKERKSFHLIESLRDYGEKTVEISCGYQHSICKTATGKVFTWGSGAHGQLGVGVRKNAIRPVLVKTPDASVKAKSVQAGYHCSYLLFENRKIFHAGALASTNSENLHFRPFNFEHKVILFNVRYSEQLKFLTSLLL